MTVKAYVHYLYFFHQKELLKDIKNAFYVAIKSSFHPQYFQTFLLPSSCLLSFLGHCRFYRRSWLMTDPKVYDIIMSLN